MEPDRRSFKIGHVSIFQAKAGQPEQQRFHQSSKNKPVLGRPPTTTQPPKPARELASNSPPKKDTHPVLRGRRRPPLNAAFHSVSCSRNNKNEGVLPRPRPRGVGRRCHRGRVPRTQRRRPSWRRPGLQGWTVSDGPMCFFFF